MRGAAAERVIDARTRKAQRVVDAVHGAGMPGDHNIHILEAAGAHHEGLRGAALFGRAAKVAHTALDTGFGQIVLHRGRGEQRRRAEQIVAAGMPVAAALDFLRLGDAGNL